VYIETTENGKRVERKVDKVGSSFLYKGLAMDVDPGMQEFLDLTDIQNKDFRYVL
jgi:hypothetical protein